MSLSPAVLFAPVAALVQIFLVYLTLARRSLGPLHRAFAAVLGSLAVWNLGYFLAHVEPGSHTLRVLSFLGVLAAGPTALAFVSAYVGRKMPLPRFVYFAAGFLATVLILNPNDLTWHAGDTTQLWRIVVAAYLLCTTGSALVMLPLALLGTGGRIRRRHYLYLFAISLLALAGGLSELATGFAPSIPQLGSAATALWSLLLAHAILRRRLIHIPLGGRFFLGFGLLTALLIALGLVLTEWTGRVEGAILALALLPALYRMLSTPRFPWSHWLGLGKSYRHVDPEAVRERIRLALDDAAAPAEIAALWCEHAGRLVPDAPPGLLEPTRDERARLAEALARAEGFWNACCLQREALENEAFLSGRDAPAGHAAGALCQLLEARGLSILSVPPTGPESPWLGFPAPASQPLYLSQGESLALRALAQETGSGLARIELTDRLRQADRLALAGSIAARVAHEIKNPLGSISGAVDVLEQQLPDRPEAHDWLRMIREEVVRLDDIVRDYLQLSRPPAPRLDAVCLRRLLERVVQSVSARPEWNLDVEWDFAGEPRVRADADQLVQVMHNILLNALHATPSGGTLRLSGRADGDDFRVDVADTGRGMEPDVLARAFEPFFTTRARGSGLGLAVSRDLIEAMGGRITLASRPGQGTTVSLRLPMHKEA